MNANNAYVYKWVHKPTYKWYVGSRTNKNAHPNDGYICSSKIVKPMILKEPNNWERTVLATGSILDMRNLESLILTLFDAKNDSRSFNQHNQDGKFVCNGHSCETIDKIKRNHKWAGKKRPEHSLAMTGKKRTLEQIEKQRNKTLGVNKSLSHVENMKKSFSKGMYLTPLGKFLSSRDAAKAHNCSKGTILNKCFGHKSRGIYYKPCDGWNFIPKEKHEII